MRGTLNSPMGQQVLKKLKQDFEMLKNLGHQRVFPLYFRKAPVGCNVQVLAIHRTLRESQGKFYDARQWTKYFCVSCDRCGPQSEEEKIPLRQQCLEMWRAS